MYENSQPVWKVNVLRLEAAFSHRTCYISPFVSAEFVRYLLIDDLSNSQNSCFRHMYCVFVKSLSSVFFLSIFSYSVCPLFLSILSFYFLLLSFYVASLSFHLLSVQVGRPVGRWRLRSIDTQTDELEGKPGALWQYGTLLIRFPSLVSDHWSLMKCRRQF